MISLTVKLLILAGECPLSFLAAAAGGKCVVPCTWLALTDMYGTVQE